MKVSSVAACAVLLFTTRSAAFSKFAPEYDSLERSTAKLAARENLYRRNENALPVIGGNRPSFLPQGRIREVTEEPAWSLSELGAKRVKIRYGPYNIPGINGGMVGKLMDGTGGMIWNEPHRNVKKPCTNCMITFMQGGLETLSGETVNTDKGLWLHHMVAINSNGRGDATCAGRTSLPHLDVGTQASRAERFFSSGNERTKVNMSTVLPTKVGYYVSPRDTFSFIIDLMNENKQSARVYMTITYEFIPGVPQGFLEARPIWFDVDQCGVSDVKPKSKSTYTLQARPWRPNFVGRLMAAGGHLHDGGTHLEIIKNGRVVCDARARYGETPAYVSRNMGGRGGRGGMGGMGGMTHISTMTLCAAPKGLDDIKPGDSWSIKGYYNYGEHPGMLNGKKQLSDVMAIAILYAAVPPRRR